MGETVNNDPFQWHTELGDTTEVNKYRQRYLGEYRRLTTIDDKRPGKTGDAAAAVLAKISSQDF